MLQEKNYPLKVSMQIRDQIKQICHDDISRHLGVIKIQGLMPKYFLWTNCFKK